MAQAAKNFYSNKIPQQKDNITDFFLKKNKTKAKAKQKRSRPQQCNSTTCKLSET